MKGSKRNEGVRCRFFVAVIGAIFWTAAVETDALESLGELTTTFSVPVGV